MFAFVVSVPLFHCPNAGTRPLPPSTFSRRIRLVRPLPLPPPSQLPRLDIHCNPLSTPLTVAAPHLTAVNMRMPDATPSVRIASILPNPEGSDAGHETITLVAVPPPPVVSLDGWTVRDKLGHTLPLTGELSVGEERVFQSATDQIRLNNDGDTVILADQHGNTIDTVTYEKDRVSEGVTLTFPDPNAGADADAPRVPVHIAALLVDPVGTDRGNETVTIKALAPVVEKGADANAQPPMPAIDLAGWTLINSVDRTAKLTGILQPPASLTLPLKKSRAILNNKGDTLTLANASGDVAYVAKYDQSQVESGVFVDFAASVGTAVAPAEGKARRPTVTIAALLPNPIGRDRGNELVTLRARGGSADLTGWKVRDRNGGEAELSGTVTDAGDLTLKIPSGKFWLHNDGDVISLVDASGAVVHTVEYGKDDVMEGTTIDFGMYSEECPSGVLPRLAGVAIASILPNPDGQDRGRETITLVSTSPAGGQSVNVTGWRLTDRTGNATTLVGSVPAGGERTFLAAPIWLHNDGDVLTLNNATGTVVDKVTYHKKEVQSGVVIDFPLDADPKTGAARLPTVQICSMMPNPDGGSDEGWEFVVLKARGGSTSLAGWALTDGEGQKFALEGEIKDGQDLSVFLTDKAFRLSDKGGTVSLVDPDGKTVSAMSYAKDEVQSGVLIDYGTTVENALVGKARLPTVMVAQVMPAKSEDEPKETITIKSRGGTGKIDGWKLKNKSGQEYKLSGTVSDEKTFNVTGSLTLGRDGELISLIDDEGREVHRVFYSKDDVVAGKALAF